MRHLLPWETLPDSEANGDSWVEVTTGGRGAGDDGKRNPDRKSPADLEEGSERCHSDGTFEIEREGCDSSDTGKAWKICQ